ncbi:hypothetical protein FOA52_006676 [Chlamydomonas sp. UWO 241]|nr:hypothetical protein FOA52_006676 [Chlamydomonas sp. UWO 241]
MDAACLSKAQATFSIELHPSKLHDVDEGVREHLNGMLFKYQDDLEGFCMSYENVKIIKKDAIIHPYFPLIHVEVRVSVLLFKPTVSSMLVGRVIKVAGDFIGLLVLGVFNASIAADAVRPEFKCKPGALKWTSKKDSSRDIEVGCDVRFQVVKLQEEAAFFGIFGSLMPDGTGVVKASARAGGGASGSGGADAASGKKARQDKVKDGDGAAAAQQPQAESGKKAKKQGKGEGGGGAAAAQPEPAAAANGGSKRPREDDSQQPDAAPIGKKHKEKHKEKKEEKKDKAPKESKKDKSKDKKKDKS